jgi:hypothetical protein
MSLWISIATLLAEDDGEGFGQVIFLVVMAVIWILGAVGKKLGQKRAEEKAQAEAERHRQRLQQLDERRRQQASRAKQASPPERPAESLVDQRPEKSDQSKLQELFQGHEENQRRIAAMDDELARAAEEQSQWSQRQQPAEPPPAPSPPPVPARPEPKPVAPPARRAARAEARKVRKRQQAALQQAQPRPRRQPSPTMPGGSTSGSSGRSKYLIGLVGHDDARRAIVFHEIFSRPKALRGNEELWD